MKNHNKTRAPRSRTKTFMGILAAMAVLSIAVGAILASQSARAQQRSALLETQTDDQDTTIQYANQKITIDAATGQLRKPTVEEARALVETLTGLTNRSSKGLKVKTAANGMSKVDLRNRFQAVVVAKPNSDGTTETKCVTTMQEATEFLGLDPTKIPAKN